MNDLIKHILNHSSPERHSITTEDGVAAAETAAQIAREQGIDCALAGGIAMHLYGFTRATTDVDMVASGLLDLEAIHDLSFGGESYAIEIGQKKIMIDWIVREDDAADVYEAALRDAAPLPNGIHIIRPEWLVIMKKLADRGKDYLDLLWMLREPGLVDRGRIATLVKSIFGRFAYVLLQGLESLYLEADLLKAKDERDEGKLEPGTRKNGRAETLHKQE